VLFNPNSQFYRKKKNLLFKQELFLTLLFSFHLLNMFSNPVYACKAVLCTESCFSQGECVFERGKRDIAWRELLEPARLCPHSGFVLYCRPYFNRIFWSLIELYSSVIQ